MNTLFPGVLDLDITPPTMKFTFEKGCTLPSVGEILTDGCNYEIMVIESDPSTSSIKTVVVNNTPARETVEKYQRMLDDDLVEIAKMIFDETKEGMIGLLEWDQISQEQRDKYVELSTAIIRLLDTQYMLRFGPYNK